jgi:hypothetical protein
VSVGCAVFSGSNGLDDTVPMIYSLTLSRFIIHYKHISFCHRININISMSFETIRQTHSKSHHHQASLKSLCSTNPSLLSLVLLKHLYTHLCILKTPPISFSVEFLRQSFGEFGKVDDVYVYRKTTYHVR